MATVTICSNTPPFTKAVDVEEGCRQEIIEKEVTKRLPTLFGTKNLKVEAELSHNLKEYQQYSVLIKNRSDEVIATMWVRWERQA